jgi:peptidoglycan/xylan/chitin deacetylase (PgdA/CDA1 family)
MTTLAGRATSARRFIGLAALSVALGLGGVAMAADACSTPGGLGVSRVLSIDTTKGARYGAFRYGTLPLAPGEVVLTFDDGPYASTTPKILAALKAECVKATFFMIGRNVDKAPAVARAVAADGHSIGSHSWAHVNMNSLSPAEQEADFDRGFASIETALQGKGKVKFYRFPSFLDSPVLLDRAQRDGVAVIAADATSEDWRGDAPEKSLARIMKALDRKKSGILLFHDSKPNTALLTPMLLKALKDQGYRVVALVPK